MAPTPPNPCPKGTKERLIAAMIRVIGTEGPHAASVRTIAREAECNEAVLYQHFPNKAAMQQAIWEEIAADMAAVLEPIASESASPEAFVRSWTNAVLTYYDEHPNAFAFAVFTFPPINSGSGTSFESFDDTFFQGLHSAALRSDSPAKALVRSIMLGVPREIHLGSLEGPAVAHKDRVSELLLAAITP